MGSRRQRSGLILHLVQGELKRLLVGHEVAISLEAGNAFSHHLAGSSEQVDVAAMGIHIDIPILYARFGEPEQTYGCVVSTCGGQEARNPVHDPSYGEHTLRRSELVGGRKHRREMDRSCLDVAGDHRCEGGRVLRIEQRFREVPLMCGGVLHVERYCFL